MVGRQPLFPRSTIQNLSKVLEKLSPGIKITSDALSQLNFIITFMASAIVQSARDLTSLSNKETISSQDVQMAVYNIFPGQLTKPAVAEGNGAVNNPKGRGHVGFSLELTRDLLKECIKMHTVKNAKTKRKSIEKGGCNTRVGKTPPAILPASSNTFVPNFSIFQS